MPAPSSTIDELLSVVQRLEERLGASERRNAVLTREIAEVRSQNTALQERNAVLELRVIELETQIAKNSRNSSKPPSSDGLTKPPTPTRKRTGKAPGKQTGDTGHSLTKTATPDRVIEHVPDRCKSCDASLVDAQVLAPRVRQVFDIAMPSVSVTEHRAQVRRCSCHTVTGASFPVEATAPTCYGTTLAAYAVYLIGRMQLPLERVRSLLSDICGVRVSAGWLASRLTDAQARLTEPLQHIQQQLIDSDVVHFDETGARVEGKGRWVHVACTERLTLLSVHDKRGSPAMVDMGVLPVFRGIAVHDFWSPYYTFTEATHAACGAHLLRECIELTEITGQEWPEVCRVLLLDILTVVTTAQQAGLSELASEARRQFTARYRAVIAEGQRLNPPPPPTGRRGRRALGKAGAFLARLKKHEEDVLRFMNDFRVDFTNNIAERGIRMVKTQQKVSGSWRTVAGARAYLAVRSYIATAHKQGQNALDVLKSLFTSTPWLPGTVPAGM